jgi:hypothetical protein
MIPWSIPITSFEGLTPAFWEDSYPTIGNKGHASSLTAVDLTNPNILTQGPGLADLTLGTNNGVLATNLRGIQKISLNGTHAYAVGGNKLYKFTSSAMISDGNFPHTIDKAVVTGETGEDVCEYQGNTYYSYDYGTAGDIGQLTGAATFDDDWMSTIPTGAAALQGGVPHQMIVGGDDTMYITNGRYIASLRTTTFVDKDLDLPVGEVAMGIGYTGNRIWVATNRPNVSSTVQAESSVYVWDGTSDSWEFQVKVFGRVGSVYIKNGVVFIFYQDVSFAGGYKLGIVSGTSIKDLTFFTGGLPLFYQITEHKNHLLWIAGDDIWAYGAATNDLPTRAFKYAKTGYTTPGGLTNVFGVPMVSSTDGASAYRFAKFSGYTVSATWNSINLDLYTGTQKSYIAKISIFTDPLQTGAKLTGTMSVNYGSVTKNLEDITYDSANPNKTRHIVVDNSIEVETLRLDLSWAGGSTTNPVKIRKIIIDGYYTPNQ